MKHIYFFKPTLLSIFLALVCLPLSAHNAPPPQKQYWYGTLSTHPVRTANQSYFCAGESISLMFEVKTAEDEFARPIAEAMVTVSDNQGSSRAATTSPAGYASIPWQAGDPGTLRLTVTSEKENYTAASPLEMAFNVIECDWVLKVDFQEEYYVVKDFGLVVGATTNWSGSLTAEPAGEGLYNHLTLQGGSGDYHFYAADQLIPYHFSLTPEISGDWTLRGEGQADQNGVHLTLGAEPVSYPQLLKFDVKDVIQPGIKILYQPPVTASDGNGLFLELNQLSSVTFPSTGGVISLDSGLSCYFYYPERSKYSLSLMLFNVRGPKY